MDVNLSEFDHILTRSSGVGSNSHCSNSSTITAMIELKCFANLYILFELTDLNHLKHTGRLRIQKNSVDQNLFGSSHLSAIQNDQTLCWPNCCMVASNGVSVEMLLNGTKLWSTHTLVNPNA